MKKTLHRHFHQAAYILFASLIILSTPARAISATASASLSQQQGFSTGVRSMLKSLASKSSSFGKVNADTLHETKIKSIYSKGGESYEISVELAKDQDKLEITAYNILGRKVLDIYRGAERSGSRLYQFYTSALPDGMYICVVQGQDFRLAEKFVVSR